MANDFSQYFTNPTGSSGGFDLASLLGGGSGGSGGLESLLDPGGILGSLFGGGGSSFKPYIDESGQYVWNDPKKYVPVPVSEVPGSRYKPTGSYNKTAESVRSIVDLLPYYSKAVAGQIIPEEQAKLEAAKAVSPGYNQLQLDLLKQFGPQLSKAGSDIALQEANQSAERDKAVLAGSGQDLINQLLASQKTIDPEFFSTRAATADSINKLLASIDPTGALSGSERSEVERSLGQEGNRRGIANAPSSLATVENATRYGKAGADKALKNQSALSQAIAAATAFLPNSRVGFDPYKVATGKDSTNSGANKFVGITSPTGNTANSQASGMLNSSTQLQTTQMGIDAQKKDWADYMNQITSSMKDIGSVAGGVAGMCWLARRVYGGNNPKWLMFREWLLTKAPNKLKNLYMLNAEKIAGKINNSQATYIRGLMNNILEGAK